MTCTCTLASPASTPLQFGRGVATADDDRPRPGVTMTKQLQFGRGVATADDTAGLAGKKGHGVSFNSAAVSPPRMTSRRTRTWSRSAALQFGRGVATADDQ